MRYILLVTILLGFLFSSSISIASSSDIIKVNNKNERIAKLKYRKKMFDNLIKMRGHYGYMTHKYALQLVDEVIKVTKQKNNNWMPPHILLALAINESDLRSWLITGNKYNPDCGICQNHTPLYERTSSKRWKLCYRLKRSTELSFIYAMDELNSIRKTYCSRRYKQPTIREKETKTRFNRRTKAWKLRTYKCLFNLYNMGPVSFYKTCKQRTLKFKSNIKVYTRRLSNCRYRERYWLRLLCFASGLKYGLIPKTPCRKAYSLDWINLVYGKNITWE